MFTSQMKTVTLRGSSTEYFSPICVEYNFVTLIRRRRTLLDMSDNEIEDVSFLPGESLHRKARYEPNIVQQIRLLFCTRRRAISLALVGGLLVLVIAILVTVSHCSCPASNGPPTTQESTPQTLTPNYTATNGQPFPYKSLRLPKSVTPTHYSLFLHPNISESWFRGHINISCKIISNTDFIVVHSKDLNISDISIINGEDGHRLPVTLWLEYKTNEQIYVELGASVSRGSTVILTVVFEGKLVKKLAGFYKSSYKTKLGETREIATTHFEPTDARAAFPCFDEPELKGTFELRMVRDLHDVALFNMPLLSSTNYTGNLRLDQFQTSVKMSTYLVAFIVCDYKQITNKTQSNITVSVYAPDDFINSAQFALDTAVKVLDYYEQFFKVKYPLPKQDLIAIPDFEAGAMENWGLITYRLTAVLYDPTMSSAHNQQWVAVVIAHELAHQWFGNLVTMEWWDDLWLNEGFASFVEYIGSSVVDETWKMKDQFVYESLLSSLRLDSLTNSHPINLPVENPNQINELFDTITYDKGASIIRMLSNFMGDDIFNDGLTSYLNTYRFSNAATTDLWSSLQQAVVDKKRNLGTDVGRMMRTWTEQMGYPVITLTRTRSKVTVTQSRFLLYKSENTSEDFTSPFGYRWEVPFTYSTSEDHQTVHKMLLKDAQDSFEITKNTSWIKGNCGRYGFYRVNYDEAGWNATIQQLNIEHQVFTIVERAGLIDDAFALARAGLLKYNTALQLTEYMVHEKDYLPWATLLENLGYIQNRIENKPVYSNYKQYILKLIKGQLDNTVWEDKGTHLEKYLRAAILSKAVHLGHKQSIEKGRQLFEQWKHNHSSINVNLKTVIYLAGIEYGTEDDWETVWRAYQSEMDASEKQKLLSVLGFSRDARLLSRLLDYSIDGNMVKPQDTASVISMVTNNLAGEILAWRFVQQHWNLFYKGYAGSSFTMSRIIKSVSGGFDTQFDLDQVQLFFKDRDAGSGKRAVKQSIEKIGINIDWLAKYEHEITDWFMRHGQ